MTPERKPTRCWRVATSSSSLAPSNWLLRTCKPTLQRCQPGAQHSLHRRAGRHRLHLRLLRAQESDLIKLADGANATHNMLSSQEASFQAAAMPVRVVGSLKAAIAAKASPVSALSIGEA